MVSRYFVYKQALMKEAEQLVKVGAIHEKEDIYYLTFEELRKVVCTKKFDYHIISRRKNEYKLYEKLAPPRVITSDDEIITGEYKRENLPAGALVGLSVSSGVIEGRGSIFFMIVQRKVLKAAEVFVTIMKRWSQGKQISRKIVLLIWRLLWELSF